jgi:glutathione synthase
MEQQDLFLRDGQPFARQRPLKLFDNAGRWFEWGEENTESLAALDVILMRKDPPFDMEYIYTTYMLERAEDAGVLVVNKPRSLRDTNEKLFTAWFPQCTPPTLVTRSAARIRGFLAEHGDIILKPLGGMGGESIFRLRRGDPNTNVTIETLTADETRFAMAQRFIRLPKATSAFCWSTAAHSYALARIPAEGETRGNCRRRHGSACCPASGPLDLRASVRCCARRDCCSWGWTSLATT